VEAEVIARSPDPAAYRVAGGPVAAARVGLADAVLMPVRPLVDFGAEWLRSHRS
jgi:hypothetical protein